jgi:polyhydroxybutyrate depolymerase
VYGRLSSTDTVLDADPMKTRTSIVVSLTVLATLAAVSGLRGTLPSHAQDPAASQDCRPGDRVLRFMADGEAHEAFLHIPRGARGPLPLVLAFHGAVYGARFVSTYYGLTRMADSAHFAVIYPQASHNVFWQLSASQHEDVDAVRKLLDRVERWGCIDTSRVYATGASNGGGFSARLGCEMAGRLAAIAPVAGGYRALGPCHPSRPLPVLEIHGTRDRVVPYGGTGPDRDGSVARFLGEWTELDACHGPPQRRTLSRGVLQLRWADCAAGSVVEHLRVAGTDHGWPGGESAPAGSNPTGLDAATTVWRFLSQFRLPATNPSAR